MTWAPHHSPRMLGLAGLAGLVLALAVALSRAELTRLGDALFPAFRAQL